MYTLFLVLSFTHLSMSRGPHHPRGESVSKHHVHYRPTRDNSEKITQDAQLLHDKEHIREDIGWMQSKALEEMTDEELEFHYFNMHDSDKNDHLDGLEILQAMRHTTIDETDDTEDDFELFVDLIDEVLLKDDKNDDGLISYPEYVAAKKENQVMNLNKVSL